VIVIGGGATGIGLLWDLTLRGLNVILLEQDSLASGTSGAFHGLLHSGARYAGSDPATAAECLAENRILRRVAREFVGSTGGIFARLEEDDPAWERRWRQGCRSAGLRPERLAIDDLRARMPALSPGLVAAYRVPDAAIDGFGLLWSLVWSATDSGARVYFGARVTGFLTDEAGVRGVRVLGVGAVRRPPSDDAGEDPRVRVASAGPVEPGEIVAPVVVNATGPWVGDVAALAGTRAQAAIPVERDKGVMIVFNSRLVSTVVNRLRPPGDGDILVPHGPVTILGTSSVKVEGPERPAPTPAEVKRILNEGRALVPGLDGVPPLRAYAGVRPLLRAGAGVTSSDGDSKRGGRHGVSGGGRAGGRGFMLIDHGQSGGPAGLLTIAGGKFTTFRAMAEVAGDLVVRLLGKRVSSRTAEVGIPRLGRNLSSRLFAPSPAAPATGTFGPAATGATPANLDELLACECEFVSLPCLLGLLDAGLHLGDLRRLTRLGMGGCQGVFCAQRLAGAMWQTGWPGSRRRPHPDEAAITREAEAFRTARLNGIKPVEWGIQARLAAVAKALDRLTLGEGDRP
jgi:glycerol-3-phosphate dehydrogenase